MSTPVETKDKTAADGAAKPKIPPTGKPQSDTTVIPLESDDESTEDADTGADPGKDGKPGGADAGKPGGADAGKDGKPGGDGGLTTKPPVKPSVIPVGADDDNDVDDDDDGGMDGRDTGTKPGTGTGTGTKPDWPPKSDGTVLPISQQPVPAADFLGPGVTAAVIGAATAIENAIPATKVSQEALTAIKAIVEVANAVIGKGGNLELAFPSRVSTFRDGVDEQVIGAWRIPITLLRHSWVVKPWGANKGKHETKIEIPLRLDLAVVRLGQAPKSGEKDLRPLGIKDCRMKRGDGSHKNLWHEGQTLKIDAETQVTTGGIPAVEFSWTLDCAGRSVVSMPKQAFGSFTLDLTPDGEPVVTFGEGDSSKFFTKGTPKKR